MKVTEKKTLNIIFFQNKNLNSTWLMMNSYKISIILRIPANMALQLEEQKLWQELDRWANSLLKTVHKREISNNRSLKANSGTKYPMKKKNLYGITNHRKEWKVVNQLRRKEIKLVIQEELIKAKFWLKAKVLIIKLKNKTILVRMNKIQNSATQWVKLKTLMYHWKARLMI